MKNKLYQININAEDNYIKKLYEESIEANEIIEDTLYNEEITTALIVLLYLFGVCYKQMDQLGKKALLALLSEEIGSEIMTDMLCCCDANLFYD